MALPSGTDTGDTKGTQVSAVNGQRENRAEEKMKLKEPKYYHKALFYHINLREICLISWSC